MSRLAQKVHRLQRHAFEETLRDIRLLFDLNHQKTKNSLGYGFLFELLYSLEFNMSRKNKANDTVAVVTKTIGMPHAAADIIFINPTSFTVMEGAQLKCCAKFRPSLFLSKKKQYQYLWWIVPLDTQVSNTNKKQFPQLKYSRFSYDDVRSAFIDKSYLITRLRLFDLYRKNSSAFEFQWLHQNNIHPSSTIIELIQHKLLLKYIHVRDFCWYRVLPLVVFLFVIGLFLWWVKLRVQS
jgi:hypothetical protein